MSSDALLDLLRAYSALLPVSRLAYPIELAFSQVHNFVLENIVSNPHLAAYPPSALYQQSFFKWIISRLEKHLADEDAAVDDRLYDKLFDSMKETRTLQGSATSLAAPPPTYVTHYWKIGATRNSLPPENVVCDHATITLYESRTTIENGTTGLRTWRASFVLARYLIAHADLICNANVLELGSGTGFLGIVAASLQTLFKDPDANPSIVLTDVNEEVLLRCTANTQLPCNMSATHPRFSVRSLDWTDSLDETCAGPLKTFLQDLSPTVVLGADVLYHPDIVPALLSTLKAALCRTPSAAAYLALTIRNPETFQLFVSETAKYRLWIEELEGEECLKGVFYELPEVIDQDVKLLKLVGRV